MNKRAFNRTHRLVAAVAALTLVSFSAAGCGRGSSSADTAGPATGQTSAEETSPAPPSSSVAEQSSPSDESTSAASSAPTSEASAQADPASLVPASIRDKGVLSMGTESDFPPMEYFKPGTHDIIGVDPDLGNAIAGVLNLKPKWTVVDWDDLIPGLKSNRFDMTIGSMGDFTDRQKQVGFVDYMNVGEAGIVAKKNADVFTTQESLCGHKVSGQIGTVAISAAQLASDACKKAGKPAISISSFPLDSDGLLAVQTGRVDMHIMDSPAAIYEQNVEGQGEKFAVSIPEFTTGEMYAIGVNKGNPDLLKAIAAAMNELIANGTYKEILDKAGLAGPQLNTMIEKATINGGTRDSSNPLG